MSQDICSICLDNIKLEHTIKILSCNHKFHFNCFKKLVYKNHNFFVNCPLCRKMNTDISKPFNDHKKNILAMCHGGVGNIRCVCETKSGLRCKNKSILMNYGKCYTHSKNTMKSEYYELYSNYMYHVLCTNYDWLSIIYLLDVGKQLMIKYLNPESNVTDILFYLYRYLNDKDYRKKIQNQNPNYSNTHYMNCIYEYYKLNKVPKSWLDYCLNKNIII